jgi:hypothetical protein
MPNACMNDEDKSGEMYSKVHSISKMKFAQQLVVYSWGASRNVHYQQIQNVRTNAFYTLYILKNCLWEIW